MTQPSKTEAAPIAPEPGEEAASFASPAAVLFGAPFFIGSLLVGRYVLQYTWGSLERFTTVLRLYDTLTIYLPLCLLVVGLLGLALFRQKRSNRRLLAAALFNLALAALGPGARLYATHIEPRRLQVRRVTVTTGKVSRPLRILHLSDIQSDRVSDYERRVFATARGLAPDLAVHTGDLLQPLPPATYDSEIPRMRELLASLAPPGGLFGVPGDTDWFIPMRDPQEFGGMKVLNSHAAEVNFDGARVRLLGLSLAESRSDVSRRVADWLAAGRPDDLHIVLGHAPDYALSLADLPVDLCLAGHTHGGQIRLPFFGPPVTLSAVPRAWARGFREIGRARLNVSAGVGCEHAGGLPCIRFNCPPEMTLIELRPR